MQFSVRASDNKVNEHTGILGIICGLSRIFFGPVFSHLFPDPIWPASAYYMCAIGSLALLYVVKSVAG